MVPRTDTYEVCNWETYLDCPPHATMAEECRAVDNEATCVSEAAAITGGVCKAIRGCRVCEGQHNWADVVNGTYESRPETAFGAGAN